MIAAHDGLYLILVVHSTTKIRFVPAGRVLGTPSRAVSLPPRYVGRYYVDKLSSPLRVWEADSIAQLWEYAINNGCGCWIHPLPHEDIPTHLNPLHHPWLTEVLKRIKEQISSTEQPQEHYQAFPIQAPVQRQATAVHEDIPFPILILANVLQLAKNVGFENSFWRGPHGL